MAKKANAKRGRGLSTTTSTTLFNNPTASIAARAAALYRVTSYEDRRLHRPDRSSAPPRSLNRNATRLRVADRFGDAIRRQTLARVMFNQPQRVMICVRRNQRREVLHALKKTGRGSGGAGRRNFWSQISCRRG